MDVAQGRWKRNLLRGVAGFLAVVYSFLSVSCRSRSENSSRFAGVGAVQISQSKRLGGWDGFRETALFKDFFFTPVEDETAEPVSYECLYISHLRVRNEKNLYSARERQERYNVHVHNAKLPLQQKELKRRALRRLGFKSEDELTKAQAQLLKQVRPVSTDFFSASLAELEQEARRRESELAEKGENIEPFLSATGVLFGWMDASKWVAFLGLGVAYLNGAAIPIGAAIAGIYGLIFGGVTTVSATVRGITIARERNQTRLVRSIGELQSQETKAQALLTVQESYELYEPRFSFDDLDLEQAEGSEKLGDLKKDKNKEAREWLAANVLELVAEDIVLAAHELELRALTDGSEPSQQRVLADAECAPDAKSIDIRNDLVFEDPVKSSGF